MEELCGNPLFCKLCIYYPTKEVNWSYHTQSIMLISEVIGCQAEQTKSIPGMKYILLSCYYWRSSTQYKLLLFAIGCLEKLGKNHYCWKYHTYGSQGMEIPSWCWLPPSWLPLIVLEGTNAGWQDWEGEINRNLIQLGTLWTVIASYTHRCHHAMTIIGVIIHSLIGFKKHSIGGGTCLCCKSGQEPMARESQAPEVSRILFCSMNIISNSNCPLNPYNLTSWFVQLLELIKEASLCHGR